MNWKEFRPIKATNDFFFLLGSLFVAIWPNIITNWLSDIAGRFLNIETSAGTWSVMVMVVASILMYLFWHRNKNPKDFQMQGGLFSLALALSQACQGVYSGPLTGEKIASAALALIPALEGALGSQFIHIRNNQPLYYLDTSIKELVSRHPRVTEKMILEHAKDLAKAHRINPFDSVSTTDVSKLIRSRMVHLAIDSELNQYLDPSQRISIDSFSDPNSWRIEKKQVNSVYPANNSSSNAESASKDKLAEMQKTERLQEKIWQRWRANFHDREALRELFEQAFHTNHGLFTSIKLEVAVLMKTILMSILSEHRNITADEQDTITLLGKLLGETKP